MKPLRLEVEGFACFRERQRPLDLSGLALFAIAGPTGAGKSTILDAMLYALYGMVPRVGRLGLAEFISHGRDVLSVSFDFSLHGRTYRLARSLKRGKRPVSTAILAELTPAGERSLADSVTDVDARILDLAGLDFDAFTQTVILPQNQFARFLQSKPRDQRAILQHLLRHAIYERMRAEAASRKDQLDRDLRSKLEQIDPLQGATADALKTHEALLDAARTERTAAQGERDAAVAFLQDVAARHQLTLDLERCRATADALAERAAEIDGVERALGAARAAAAVAPLIDGLERAQRRSASCADDVEAARRTVHEREQTLEAAGERVKGAEGAAAGIEALRTLVRRLDEIRADVERQPAVARELDGNRRSAAVSARRVEAARTSVEVRQAAHAAASAAVNDARQALEAMPADPDRHARLDEHREIAVRAMALGKHLEDLRHRNDAVTAHRAAGAQEILRRTQAEAEAKAQLDRARQDRQRAERARLDGSHRHAAAELRRDLVAGEPCPVCEQVVSAVPAGGLLPELTELDAATERARHLEAECAEAREQAGRDLAAAEARAGELAGALHRLEQEILVKHAERRTCLDRLAEAMAPAARPDDDDLLPAFERQLAEARKDAAERRRRHEARVAAEHSESATALALATAQGELREAEQAHGQVLRDLERLEGELRGIDVRIAAVTSAADPAAERAAAAVAIVALEQEVASARMEASEAAAQLAAAQARFESCERALAGAARDRDERLAAVAVALETHGFASAAVVAGAARTSEQMQAMDRQLSQYREARASTETRLAELRSAVEGREVAADAVRGAQARAQEAEQRLHDAVATASKLDEQVQVLRRDVARARQLASEAEGLRARLAVTAEMALDLRSDGFQDYLLEEAFRGLVAGASTRLQQMSRRYAMEWRAGEFYVIDHDNAGECRRAETLSGGETFMASLCLALQLSDEILHASGALRMDSLFIDEGFGTLDTQALSEVTDALESLRQEGDRVIGIISHRPELTERLPGCIRVDKGVGESTWVVERVG